MPHPHNVRKRIKQLKDYINVTPGKPKRNTKKKKD